MQKQFDAVSIESKIVERLRKFCKNEDGKAMGRVAARAIEEYLNKREGK